MPATRAAPGRLTARQRRRAEDPEALELVEKVAGSMSRRSPWRKEEFVEAGHVALVESARDWKPGSGSFLGYVARRIRWKILNSFRDERPAGFKGARWDETPRTTSLDLPLGHGDDAPTLADGLADPLGDEPGAGPAVPDHDALDVILAPLSGLARSVVEAVSECPHDDGYGFAADRLGIRRERAQRLYSGALAKLRAMRDDLAARLNLNIPIDPEPSAPEEEEPMHGNGNGNGTATNGHAPRIPGLDAPEAPPRRKPGRPKGSGTTSRPATPPAPEPRGPLPRGVRRQPSGRFTAYIKFHGKERSLGTFDTVEEAAEVARIARERVGLEGRPKADPLAEFLAEHPGPGSDATGSGADRPGATTPAAPIASPVVEAELMLGLARLLDGSPLDRTAIGRVLGWAAGLYAG